MKCNSCGTEVSNGQAFCPACGAQQVQQAQPAQQQYQPAQPQQNYYQPAQQQQYGAQQSYNPQGQYGAQQPQYNAPQGQPYNPQGQYGAPQGQYGAPQGQPYNPQAQYGAPQGQYGGQYQQNNYAQPVKQETPALIAFAHVPVLFWLGLIDGTPRGKKAATQGLWLFIANIAVSIAIAILSAIFTALDLGIIALLFSFVSWGWSIAVLVFSIMGIVKGFNGQDFEVPLVGKMKIFDK